MPTVRSVCPFDCPDACGLLVEVADDGRAVAVRGDPQHPYSQGTLCPKMNRYERSVHSPERLETPLLRDGAKGSGRFRRATWDEAIATITARWKAILAADGGEAILPYSYAGSMGVLQRNAGHAFFHRMGASRLDRTICTPAQGAGWHAVMGDTPGPHPDTVLDSDLVVLWGIHAVATNLHFLHRVKEARRRGAEVWTIETWRTATADLADRVILVRPGSDGALALALMHVLAREGLADEAFLAAETIGWPELSARVLAEHSPERAAAVTGLDVATIEDLARRLARARAPFVRVGGGPTRYGNGAMTTRSITALGAVLGAPGRKGGGVFASTNTSSAFPVGVLHREDLQPKPARIVNMNRLGEALTALSDPPIRSMYVYCSNPAAVAPDQNAVLRGLAREDLFLVVHERFLTDTARFADVVLPATTSLEHADLYRSYGHYCVQRVQPAIRPLGESKPNWDTFQLLARAMGFEDEIFTRSADELIDLLVAQPAPQRDGLAPLVAGAPAVELQPNPGARWRTPSGKIELRNAAHEEPLPRHLPSHEDGGALPLRLQTAPAIYTLNSTFMERPELREKNGGMSLKISPADAAARGLADGAPVVAWNERGEVRFRLEVTDRVPAGVAVAEGVWWLAHAPGDRNVNALTSQRLTDEAGGSTFYDTRIDLRRA
jgi:anaerobic selenocysteine-containing dehydrogenase